MENNTIYYKTMLTKEEAIQMAGITNQVDQLETKSPETILANAAKLGCVIAMAWDQIVGCIWLTKFKVEWHTLFERWSLWVSPEFRKRQISSTLVKKLIKDHPGKTLICLTKEAPVHHICQHHLWRGSHLWYDLQGTSIGKALEANWDLINKYKIYTNDAAVELFNTLQVTTW